MEIVIREMSWFKRREPTTEPKAVSVKIEGFERINNHMCKMIATYDDGHEYDLIARVIQNAVTGKWSIYGLDSKGHAVYCDITDE